MTAPGSGDRWLSGDLPDGVGFGPSASVTILDGPHAGATGTVRLLLALQPEPLYLVTVRGTGQQVRIGQSALGER